MRRLLIGVLCTLCFCTARAQPNWGPTGFPGDQWSGGYLCTSPTEDTLYYAGTIALGGSPQNTNRVLRYTNADWDTLPGVVPGNVFTILQHRDTLFIGGGFTTLNGEPSGRVAYHDGTVWRSYGSILGSYAARLRIIEDTLYVVGAFDSVDGQPAQSVAKRVGDQWVPVGQTSTNGPIIGDITKYDGRLVISGAIAEGQACCAFQLIDDIWQPLGQGVLGGLSGVHSLEVYGDDLYLGGQFTTGPGNAGMNIMRWDGMAYHAMGAGIQYAPNNFSTLCSAKMLVHEGLLWVRHGCNYAGGVTSKGIATWDGTEWCGVPGDLVSDWGSLTSMAFYQDTLFVVKLGDTLDGVFTNGVGKFIGESYVGECSGPVGVTDLHSGHASCHLESIGTDQWIVAGLPAGQFNLVLFDAIGRILLDALLRSDGLRTEPISTASLPAGAYMMSLAGAQAVQFKLLVRR